MGALNCKCESEEDKTVVVEKLGKNKTENTAPAPTMKMEFSQIIPEYTDTLGSQVKAV